MAIPTSVEAPTLYETATQRQVGALEQVSLAEFQTIRSLGGSADATFSFGPRASRPASGAQGDRYYATDIGARGGFLYYYTGTAWELLAGQASGTDAQRSAYTPDATDDGGFFRTTDTGKTWEVSGGAWVDRTLRLQLPRITPAQITANTNNYNPGTGSFFRITTDASRNITGIVAGADGDVILLRNAGAFDFVLTDQDVASTAANRIITGTGASVTYAPDETAVLVYDTTTARWVLIV